MITTDPNADPAKFAAEVIREAVTCDRPECGPWTHARFVETNLDIAREAVNKAGGAQ